MNQLFCPTGGRDLQSILLREDVGLELSGLFRPRADYKLSTTLRRARSERSQYESDSTRRTRRCFSRVTATR